MPVKSEAQKLIQDAVINLLHISHPTAGELYFSNSQDDPLTDITFDSNDYLARRFTLGNFKVRATGALPRPTLELDNVDRYWYPVVSVNDDLLAATITYREVYRQNLDDGSDPDTSQIITQVEYIIRQRERINNDVVRFRLATPLDVEQAKFGRPMMRHICTRNYRSPKAATDTFYDVNDSTVFVDCPYVGSSYFKKDGSAGADWTEDDCGQRLSDCNLRFPAQELPYMGFPTIGDPNA